jgi:hypothetical protein
MRRSALPLALVLLLLLAAPAALAAVSITRAELDGGQVRVEGRGAVAGVSITVSSPESTATGRADSGGSFRVEASSFRSSTCRVTVTDGASSAEATLSGCTASAAPTPSPAPTPTPTPAPSPSPTPTTCMIVPTTFADGNVGTLNTWYFVTTGCRTSEKPVRFNVVSGRIPPGTTLFTQGAGSGGITGRPTTEGLFAFTIEVQDQTGARDTESFSIRINQPRPLVITNQSDVLSPGTVGQFYCCGNLFADGGVPDYSWSLRAGQLPPGLRLTASPGRSPGRRPRAGRSRSSSASPTRAARRRADLLDHDLVMLRTTRVLVWGTAVGLLLAAVLAAAALAAVSITRAELSDSKLRVEGRGATPNTTVTVNCGQASATSDGSGNLRIERTGFAAPADCRVVVSDGTSSASATLSGRAARPALRHLRPHPPPRCRR